MSSLDRFITVLASIVLALCALACDDDSSKPPDMSADAEQDVPADVGNDLSDDSLVDSEGDAEVTAELEWLQSMGGSETDWVNDLHLLADGSIVVVGGFSDSATFGAGQLNETSLTSSGGEDAFWARYDSEGQLEWVYGLGGGGNDSAWVVTVQTDGDIVLAGQFEQTVVFGSGQENETSLTTTGSSLSLFVARYSTGGELRWVQQGSSSNAAWPNDMTSWGDTIVVVGGFWSNVVFDPGGSSETSFNSAGERDAFFAQFDGDGMLLASDRCGTSGNEVATGVAATASGSLLMTGWFSGDAVMFPAFADAPTLTSNGSTDVFVMQVNDSMEVEWAVGAGSGGDEMAGTIVAMDDGSVLTCGMFRNTIGFGQGEDNETALTSVGSMDVYVVKFEADGGLVWAVRGGGPDSDWCLAAGAAADGRAYAVGSYGFSNSSRSSSITIGAGETNETTLNSVSGRGELYVAAFDADGTTRWARQGASEGASRTNAVVVAPDGVVWIGGFFQGYTLFSQSEQDVVAADWSGAEDGFIAKYNP